MKDYEDSLTRKKLDAVAHDTDFIKNSRLSTLEKEVKDNHDKLKEKVKNNTETLNGLLLLDRRAASDLKGQNSQLSAGEVDKDLI